MAPTALAVHAEEDKSEVATPVTDVLVVKSTAEGRPTNYDGDNDLESALPPGLLQLNRPTPASNVLWHTTNNSQQQTNKHKHKKLAVSPGRLGLTLQFPDDGRVGALIMKIDPACTFIDKIVVGDKIVSIDDRPL